MCVIALALEKRPTENMIEAMYEANPSGAGIAWRGTAELTAGKEKGKTVPVVHWKKGLDLDQVKALALEEVALPFCVHFRIPSVGGDTPHLTHPFPIAPDSPCDLEGTTRGFVLFHNGHWSDWKKWGMDLSTSKGEKMPDGRWSDSRAMAWMAAHLGVSWLDFLDEKVIAFGPQDIQVFQGKGFNDGWHQIGGKQDIYVSNRIWENRTHRNYGKGGASGDGACDYPMMRPPASMGGGHHHESANLPLVRQPSSGAEDTSTTEAGVDGAEKTNASGITKGRRIVTPGGVTAGSPFAITLKGFAEGTISRSQFKREMAAFDKARKQIIALQK